MKRIEKIKLIKGILRGNISYDDVKPPEVEVWFQEIGTDIFEHFKTGEKLNVLELEKKSMTYTHKNIIQIIFVEGKTIL
jgi:hypothetical protein